MKNVYSVGQVNAYIKNMFAQDFMLSRIYVKGEVSNCKYHSSGHIYFSLKDGSGAIACILFAGQRKGLGFPMKDGQQVICLGSISSYERDGKYQLYAREIVLDGAGLLYERFEALKKELEEMGMFSQEYKQPIPKYAKRIGIVTAPTGAAIRDIMNISARRNPYVQLILYPALVQGEAAAESIVKGIKRLQREEVDLIIVGRGGGSIEDLWAFNEEIVARAIFDCRIPVISAVGHETDTTISDYVADLRAPTPSAAAELAVYEYRKVSDALREIELRLKRAFGHRIDLKRMKTNAYRLKLRSLHPGVKLREKQHRLSELEKSLRQAMAGKLGQSRQKAAILAERMNGLSPLTKLGQGYSYVASEKGTAVKHISDVKKGDALTIYVTDGRICVRVEDTSREDYCGR